MKRFTECSKWRDQWYRKLPPRLKCLWQFLCDNCDAAGVIDLDWDLASFQIGEDVCLSEIAALEGRVVVLPNGKLWIESFIRFQYGNLSLACGPHRPVFALIKKHGLERVIEAYQAPTEALLDMDKDKEEDKDKGSPEGKPTTPSLPTQFPVPLDTEGFRSAWTEYLTYRKERRLSKLIPRSEAAQLKELAGMGEADAIASIRQTIAKQWQGLFPPKGNQTFGSRKQPNFNDGF